MKRAIAAIDIGTTKVTALVATGDGASVRVVGAGTVPSHGVEKGMVADMGLATEAIAAAVREAERSSGYRISKAYVSVGGSHVLSRNASGEAAVMHALRGVEQADVDRALGEAGSVSLPPERQVMHVVPRGFWLDGNVLVRDPLGMAAYRLVVEVHIVTALESAVTNLVRCVEGVGVEVAGLILQSLASGEAVLTENERDMGVALVDIGGGTTDIAVYLNGGVWHTANIPTGGNHVTNDLAIGLHSPFEVAEDVKLRFGHCVPAEVGPEEKVRIAGFAGNAGRETSRQEVVEIVQARVEEIFSLILRELRRSSYDGLLSAGVVLCGGTANLPGMATLGADVLGMPVRVVMPRRAEGLTEIVGSTAQATGVGLLLWGLRQPFGPDEREDLGLWQKLGRSVRSFLPGRVSGRS
ncbi:MAG: cell division protein FtsA [Anaerolineae bacterium]